VRASVHSDTHFGAWTGEPLLQHDWARRRLGDALEDVDELVLLGDLFDFLFSSVENAFAQADGFFSLIEGNMAGKRIVSPAETTITTSSYAIAGPRSS
jgi:hypothetical protein